MQFESNKRLFFKQLLSTRQLFSLITIIFLTIGSVQADSKRSPANFVANDDLIFVPLEYETHFLVRSIDLKKTKIIQIKNQIDRWDKERAHAEEWGLDKTGMYRFPTQLQKFDFFKRYFLRYVSREARKPLEADLKDWWNSSDVESEIEIINSVASDIEGNGASGSLARKVNTQKTIKAGKGYKFKFRARPLRGFVSLSFKSPFVNINSVVGLNGNIEVKVDRNFSSFGLYTMANFDISAERNIYYVQKSLTKRISTTVTSIFSEKDLIKEDHKFAIRFSTKF